MKSPSAFTTMFVMSAASIVKRTLSTVQRISEVSLSYWSETSPPVMRMRKKWTRLRTRTFSQT